MADVHTQRPGKDPLLDMDFLVELEGIADVGFMEFSGVKKNYGVPEYREGDGPEYPYKQRGGASVDNVTLRRGIFKDDATLQEWFDSGERKTVDIVRLRHDRDGDRRADVTRLYEAWPVSLDRGSGDATSEDSNAIEEMEIAYEDWDMNP